MTDRPTPPITSRRNLRIPYLVLSLGLAVTAAAAVYARIEINGEATQQAHNYARLAAIVDRLTGHMYSRMQRIDVALRAGAAIAPEATAPFALWAQTLDTMADFHSFSPVAFSSKNVHDLSEELLGGVPGTTIHTSMKSAADKSFLLFAASADPESPRRRYVAIAPVRTGDAQATPVGFVYTRLNIDELMLSELARAPHVGLRVRLYYSVDTSAANLAYDSDRGTATHPFKSSYREDHTIFFFGTPWALTVDASPESGVVEKLNPVPTVIATGAIITLLLFVATGAKARAQASAKDTAVRYDALFTSTPLPMWVYDRETLMILAVNDAAIVHYGYNRDEFLKLSITDLRQPQHQAALLASTAQSPKGFHNAGVWQHYTRHGEVIDVDITAHAILFEGRHCEVVVANDVSARLRAESEVRESEARLRQMADHIDETFFVVDVRAGVTLYISPAWGQIAGQPSDPADPMSWFSSIHPDDLPRVVDAQAAVLRGEVATNVFRVVRPDGTVRWARGRSFPVRNAEGEVYRMVGVVSDITELRQVEARFAQSQKMEAVGQLAGGIAHDFNNLLTVILGEVDQLLDLRLPPAAGGDAVTEIRIAGQRAAALTHQLLAFSRRQLIAPTVFDITTTVSDLSSMLRRLIGENIALDTKLAGDTWQVRADRGQIEQVMANLVVNARDAMATGGRLTIATSNVTIDQQRAEDIPELAAGDYVALSVSDTGTGMTEEVRARVFEPFFTTKEVGKGTGLGLATCYGIVKQAEGHMTVYSEPGLGTTVTVYLPRGIVEPAPVIVASAVALPRGTETILLVEDEPAVRRIGARLLAAQGYHILEAENGADGVRVSQEYVGEIHLLMTDVVMPGMGGREIAELLRVQRPKIKILFASGYTDDIVLQHRLLEKHVALLQKPFSREAITCKVREVLDADVSL